MIAKERLAAIRSSVESTQWSTFLSEIDRRDLLAAHDELCAENERLRAELAKATSACQTLGKIVDRQAVDICRIANVPMPESGDADFEKAWSTAFAMAEEIERLRAQVAAVEALIGYGYSVTRSADQGGGVAIVIEETAIEDALATAWDDGWTVGASALTDGYKSGRPNPHRAALASAGDRQCEHTEHAIRADGRVGRTFQGLNDPIGRWERCDAADGTANPDSWQWLGMQR